MKYLFLFIRIFADKALQIKLNIKRNWKFFKKEFRKEPILHKKSRVFRRNFVKYTRLYRLLTAEKRLIELEFIKKSEKSLDIVYKVMMVMLTSFITLFIPFQVNVFISAQNIDIYGSILITGVLIALAATLFLLFFLAYSFGSIKQYIIAYILLAGLWFLVLVSPRLENSIIYHISLSTLSIISVEYFIWQYLSYKKEILLARRLAIQIKNNV
ncbi:MAG: hypothetical protein E7E42_02280 [Veillonella sp.]|jgi:hypothetical protein|uniref:hypothetical protein n=1 Tax=Veillonella sp. TaxID=1926307 RepID=UPI0029014BAD|nr:hypothetical protein [Veillonella sp.]MDU2208489.1 hypothetical protein [Veillonella sp.]MDU3706511.1 hypothetical protein [Veillonella sp.]